MSLEIKVGDVIRLSSFQNQFPGPKGKSGLIRTSFKAPKGKVFVAILMGLEPKEGTPPLDVAQILRSMGWVPAEEASKAQGS